MKKSLYISHVLYKVNDLNKSVNEFIKKGFHVEFGSKIDLIMHLFIFQMDHT